MIDIKNQFLVCLLDFLLERVALFDKLGIINHGNTLATENQSAKIKFVNKVKYRQILNKT